MKTPRELLFERHRHVEPKLDEIRRQVLAVLPVAESAVSSAHGHGAGLLILEFLRRVWLELIWPSRRAWAGLVVIWLGVLVANLELRISPGAVPATEPALAREAVQSYKEQQRLLTELLPPGETPSAQTPRSGPRQRSDRSLPFKAC